MTDSYAPATTIDTVSRESDAIASLTAALVHKRQSTNVWLSDPETGFDDGLRVRFHTPPTIARARISELIEAQRQAGLHYVHARLGIPFGFTFLLTAISLRRKVRTVPSGHLPPGGVIETKLHEGRRGGKTELYFTLSSGEDQAEGSAQVHLFPPAVYERLRIRGGVPLVRVETIARHIQAEHLSGVITPDIADPVLSDHGSDHVSAMAVIVAIEKGLLDSGTPRIDALSAEFHAYMEHSPQPTYEIALMPDGAFIAVVQQNGLRCVTITGESALAHVGSPR